MKVELPFLAEGVEGGDVVHVLVNEGDRVTEGQALLELETDKATVPVPSPAAGAVTKLLVRQGDHVQVGQALAELDGGAGESPEPASQPQQTERSGKAVKRTKKGETPERSDAAAREPAQPSSATDAVEDNDPRQDQAPPKTDAEEAPQSTTRRRAAPAPASDSASTGVAIPASPSVRRLARELGVDLARVKGSEAGGRITAEDVTTYVRERTRRLESSQGTGGGSAKGGVVFTTLYGHERREALPSLRRKIAATMTQAWSTIPHVHQFQDADVTDLLDLQSRYAPKFQDKGVKLTLTSLLVKATTHALKLYPQLNATLDLTNGEVVYKEYYNIGVAVDTAAGLIVPVIHQADKKDLFQISVELADVAERTRARQVKLEELRGASFTISNMGGLGAGPFTPIINPPEVGILGVGRGRLTPVYREDRWVPRMMLPLCLAYDHRLIDGADGARFTNEVVRVLEDFQAMFLGL